MGNYISVLLSVLQTVFYDGPVVKTMGNYISVLLSVLQTVFYDGPVVENHG